MRAMGSLSLANVLRMAFASCALMLCAFVHAATPVGTEVENQATVTYGDETQNNLERSSEVDQFQVQELTDLSLVLLADNPVEVASPSQQALIFELTHLGNGEQVYLLELANLSADQYDAEDLALWLDANGSGEFEPLEDTLYNPNEPPLLQPDESLRLFVFGAVPEGLAINDIALVSLSAIAEEFVDVDVNETRTLEGQGDGGFDLVAGANNAQQTIEVQLLVTNNASLVLTKTVHTIADPEGGEEPVPGAEVTYQIRGEFIGEGELTDIVITDAIPEHTDYVPGTLVVDGVANTDADDADNAHYDSLAAEGPQVVFDMGDLTAPRNDLILQFTVSIR